VAAKPKITDALVIISLDALGEGYKNGLNQQINAIFSEGVKAA
jgi:hypothetical protein